MFSGKNMPRNLKGVTFSAADGMPKNKCKRWESFLRKSLAPTFAQELGNDEVWMEMRLAYLPNTKRCAFALKIVQRTYGWATSLASSFTLCEPKGGIKASRPQLCLVKEGVVKATMDVNLFVELTELLLRKAKEHHEELMTPLVSGQKERKIAKR